MTSSCTKRDFRVDSDQLSPARTGLVLPTRGEAMKGQARDDYGPVAKTLHWATVLLVIVAWTLGMFGEELFEESAQGSGLLTHIWIGLTILVVALVRIPWRVANPPPKIVPTEFGRWLVEWTDPASRLNALCPLWIVGGGTWLGHRAAVRTGPFAAAIWGLAKSHRLGSLTRHSRTASRK